MSNRQMEDLAEEAFHRHVAEEINLEVSELDELMWEEEVHETSDGVFLGWIIHFHEGSNPEVLRRVKNLQNGSWVIIDRMP